MTNRNRGEPVPGDTAKTREPQRSDDRNADDGDLSDMLDELRVLLPGAQLLTAFLITVPFSAGFADIVAAEKTVFLATFVLSITSLILLSAPAVQHRLVRPLTDRARFKRLASKQILAGSVVLSMALTIGTQLVLSEVFGSRIGIWAAGFVATLIVLLWWVFPMWMKASRRI